MRSHYKIIKDLKNLVVLSDSIKNELEKKLVFTNGCFDVLHAGHIHLLEKARGLGDVLMVAINSDDSIKQIKGDKRPVINQNERALIIAALGCVDLVYVFNEDTPYKLIHMLKPNVLVKGGDWEVKNIIGSDVVMANGGKVMSIPIKFETSTTNIIDNILSKYKD